jgi:hypothetical protein
MVGTALLVVVEGEFNFVDCGYLLNVKVFNGNQDKT